jgi:response regulator of citrate/malate metabolism
MRILIVDDEPGQAKQVAMAIRDIVAHDMVDVCNNEQDAKSIISAKKIDIAICDLILSDSGSDDQGVDANIDNINAFCGLRILSYINDMQPTCKVIVVSSSKFINEKNLNNMKIKFGCLVAFIRKNKIIGDPSGGYGDKIRETVINAINAKK